MSLWFIIVLCKYCQYLMIGWVKIYVRTKQNLNDTWAIYHLIDCKLNSLRFCSYFYFCNILLSCQIYEFPFRCGTLNRIKEVFTKEVKSLIYNRLWREGSMSLRRGCSSCQSGRTLQGWTTGAPWRWGRRPSSLAGSSSYSRDTWWVQSLILMCMYMYKYTYTLLDSRSYPGQLQVCLGSQIDLFFQMSFWKHF